MFRNLLQQWLKPKRRPITRPTRRRHLRLHLRLEMLEDRITPSTVTVTNESQLETAIQQANTNSAISAIVLQAGGTYDPHAELTITATQALTIQGNGSSASATVLDPNSGDDRVLHQNRVFHVESGANVTFQNLTIQGGTAINANGGGILDEGGKVALSNVVLQNNTAASGGGVYQSGGGSLTIEFSTVQGNSATGADAHGGGVYGTNVVVASSTLTGNQLSGSDTAQGGGAYLDGNSQLVNTTVAENNASGLNLNGNLVAGEGGGLYFNAGNATLTNVTVVGNIAGTGGGVDTNSGANPTVALLNTLVYGNQASTGADFDGGVSDQGHNLIGSTSGVTGDGFNGPGDKLNIANPNLGPLANNGGPTQTVAILPPSPALDGGDNSALSVLGQFDQRGQGFPRNVNGTVDIGAYEYQTPSASPPPAPPPASPPTGGSGNTNANQTPAPPSLPQALIALFIDGVYLDAEIEFFSEGSGETYTVGAHQGATTLLEFATIVGHLDGPIGSNQPQADIAANLPYAGPFGLVAVVSGVQAAEQFIQDSAAQNPQTQTFDQAYEEAAKTSPIGLL